MNIHLRIHRWVIWWFYVGVIGGIIAFVNIWGHNLTGFQERLLLIVGAAFWVLGGAVCWAFESVKVEPPPLPPPTIQKPLNTGPATEWHPASDFLMPGRRKSLLPWRH
jgi:hypothetical protein